MLRVVFLDRGTVPISLRKPVFSHVWRDYDQTAPNQVAERLFDADIVVTNKVRLDEEALSRASHLRLIAVTATGFDNIRTDICRQRGIAVANVPGYARSSVPEHVLMMVLALRRNLLGYYGIVQNGRWQQSSYPNLFAFPIKDLHGSVLGLVGYGSLAKGVERLARAFGMEVLISERKGATVIRSGRLSFESVLKQADILSLHAPLSAETRQMIGAHELFLMKPTALLINTARGGLLDESALANALQSGRLGGAGLDVLSQEPPSAENPLLNQKLPNLLITPHVAWTSQQALEILAEQVICNLEAFVMGKPENLVAA